MVQKSVELFAEQSVLLGAANGGGLSRQEECAGLGILQALGGEKTIFLNVICTKVRLRCQSNWTAGASGGIDLWRDLLVCYDLCHVFYRGEE